LAGRTHLPRHPWLLAIGRAWSFNGFEPFINLFVNLRTYATVFSRRELFERCR